MRLSCSLYSVIFTIICPLWYSLNNPSSEGYFGNNETYILEWCTYDLVVLVRLMQFSEIKVPRGKQSGRHLSLWTHHPDCAFLCAFCMSVMDRQNVADLSKKAKRFSGIFAQIIQEYLSRFEFQLIWLIEKHVIYFLYFLITFFPPYNV